jgi:hypothetical protein
LLLHAAILVGHRTKCPCRFVTPRPAAWIARLSK